jgi:YggT family protein
MTALNEIFGYLIQTLLSLYLMAMLLRFLLQLVRADFYNPISQLLLVNGLGPPNILLLLVWSVLGVVALLVNIYFFALLAMIILSWVAPGSHHPAIYLLHQITEPVMAPFRKALPPMGGMDFSPILLFILINVVQIALRHMAAGVGLHPALVIGL